MEAPVRGSLQEASPSPLPNSLSYRTLLHPAIFPGACLRHQHFCAWLHHPAAAGNFLSLW